MKIGVVLPSRGLIFSRTIESILRNTVDHPGWQLYMSHDLPIPDCFNEPLWRALDDGCSYIWFVEEDMLIPDGLLNKMFLRHTDVVSVDYADKKTGRPFLHKNNKGEVIYTGVGCMLVKRDVIKRMQEPVFRESLFEQQPDGNLIERTFNRDRKIYGTQDVYFCSKIRELGYKIEIVENAGVGHLKLVETGKPSINQGQHLITAVYL